MKVIRFKKNKSKTSSFNNSIKNQNRITPNKNSIALSSNESNNCNNKKVRFVTYLCNKKKKSKFFVNEAYYSRKLKSIFNVSTN